MRRFLERLAAGEVLVGDGAWGTLLMARGLPAGQPPEMFNLSRPEVIEDIARLYLEAGADLITTNTFGGSPVRLRLHGLEAQVDALNQSAVEAARRAVGSRAYVSGSIGPSGRLLKPYGDLDSGELAESFAVQARALADAGVDLFCIETMTDLAEAQIAVRAARAAGPALPIVATMTFEPTRRGFFTVMGVSVEQASRGLVEAGADLVGSNCGNGIEAMVAIARAFHDCSPLPVAIQANAGLPETIDGALVYRETPEQFGAAVPALVDARVQLVGGCCGTTPAHVRAMRDAVSRAARP
jgi:5-methyltetrahydrofolate--homocysteine methyltransferase